MGLYTRKTIKLMGVSVKNSYNYAKMPELIQSFRWYKGFNTDHAKNMLSTFVEELGRAEADLKDQLSDASGNRRIDINARTAFVSMMAERANKALSAIEEMERLGNMYF